MPIETDGPPMLPIVMHRDESGDRTRDVVLCPICNTQKVRSALPSHVAATHPGVPRNDYTEALGLLPKVMDRTQLLVTIDLAPDMAREERAVVTEFVRRALYDADDRIHRIWVDEPALPYLSRFTVARDGSAYVVLDLGGRGQRMPSVVAHTSDEAWAFEISDAMNTQHASARNQQEEATA